MVRATGSLHREDLIGEVMLIIAALAIAVGLVLPLWGLAVILFDFAMVFLPVLIAIGLTVIIVRLAHLRKAHRH